MNRLPAHVPAGSSRVLLAALALALLVAPQRAARAADDEPTPFWMPAEQPAPKKAKKQKQPPAALVLPELELDPLPPAKKAKKAERKPAAPPAPAKKKRAAPEAVEAEPSPKKHRYEALPPLPHLEPELPAALPPSRPAKAPAGAAAPSTGSPAPAPLPAAPAPVPTAPAPVPTAPAPVPTAPAPAAPVPTRPAPAPSWAPAPVVRPAPGAPATPPPAVSPAPAAPVVVPAPLPVAPAAAPAPAEPPPLPAVEPVASEGPVPLRWRRPVAFGLLAGLWQKQHGDGREFEPALGLFVDWSPAPWLVLELQAARAGATAGNGFASTSARTTLLAGRALWAWNRSAFSVLAGAGAGTSLSQTTYQLQDVGQKATSLDASAFKLVLQAGAGLRVRPFSGLELRLEVTTLLRDGRLEPLLVTGAGWSL